MNKRSISDELSKIKFPTLLLIAFIVAVCVLLISMSILIVELFGYPTPEQILFHLQFPLDQVDDNIRFKAYKRVFLSIGAFFFILLLPYIARFCVSKAANRLLSHFVSIIKRLILLILHYKFAFCAVLFIASIAIVNKNLHIYSLLRYTNKKDYSSFYEEHYISPNSINIAAPDHKQNLIIIFAESMESTFSAQNIPNGGGGNRHIT